MGNFFKLIPGVKRLEGISTYAQIKRAFRITVLQKRQGTDGVMWRWYPELNIRKLHILSALKRKF